MGTVYLNIGAQPVGFLTALAVQAGTSTQLRVFMLAHSPSHFVFSTNRLLQLCSYAYTLIDVFAGYDSCKCVVVEGPEPRGG